MSLLMPILLVLMFLVWDVGQLLLYRSQVVNVSYAIARSSAQYGEYRQLSAQNYAVTSLRTVLPNVNTSTTTVSGSVSGSNSGYCENTVSGNDVRVTVTYRYTPLLSYRGLFTPGVTTVSGTGIARCEVVR